MKKILSNILGGLNVPKVIEAVKGNDTQVKSGKIKSLAITGTTILTTGIAFVTDGVYEENTHALIGGSVLLIIWLIFVERMGDKISKIDSNDSND